MYPALRAGAQDKPALSQEHLTAGEGPCTIARCRVALRITQASVQRKATDDFPTRVDVRVPGSGREFAEVEPQSRPDGQPRGTRPQRVLVGGIESCFDGKVVLPAIATENQRALVGVV